MQSLLARAPASAAPRVAAQGAAQADAQLHRRHVGGARCGQLLRGYAARQQVLAHAVAALLGQGRSPRGIAGCGQQLDARLGLALQALRQLVQHRRQRRLDGAAAGIEAIVARHLDAEGRFAALLDAHRRALEPGLQPLAFDGQCRGPRRRRRAGLRCRHGLGRRCARCHAGAAVQHQQRQQHKRSPVCRHGRHNPILSCVHGSHATAGPRTVLPPRVTARSELPSNACKQVIHSALAG